MQVSIECLPWKRCLKSAEEGKFDGVLNTSFKKEREQFLIFPKQTIEVVSYVFVTLKETTSNWGEGRNFLDLPQPVGAPFGWSVTDQLMKENLKITMDVNGITDDEESVRKLLAGRVKSIVIESTVAMTIADKLGARDRLKILNPPYSDGKGYYLAISRQFQKSAKNAQALADAIDLQLSQTAGNPSPAKK